jgi:predicted nucleic-acid-binding Zn-ribbon protein
MSRDSEKHSRSDALLCPTCGCSSFETHGGAGEAVRMTKCVSCGREATRDDLIRENSENISIMEIVAGV